MRLSYQHRAVKNRQFDRFDGFDGSSHADALASEMNSRAIFAWTRTRLVAHYRPHVPKDLRIVGGTFATATLPFVRPRSNAALVMPLRDALADVFASASLADIADATLLCGFTPCDANAYDSVMTFEREATVLGYPTLA